MKGCRNCKHGLKRCEFSFKKYGNYYCNIECCLPENERMPYRRNEDICDKYEEREDRNDDKCRGD